MPSTKTTARKTTATRAKAPAGARSTAAGPVPRKTAPETAAVASAKGAKVKQKLVRDSFTMPRADFALIDGLKERALGFKRPAKKSELLRAGLHALSSLDDVRLRQVLDGLAPLKPGRPKNEAV